jgi:hypothetical protein
MVDGKVVLLARESRGKIITVDIKTTLRTARRVKLRRPGKAHLHPGRTQAIHAELIKSVRSIKKVSSPVK